MSFRLRRIEFMANGRRLVRDRDVDATVLTIGRAADNDVHLPDLGVDPHHARLTRRAGSRVMVESSSGLGFSLDGKTVRSADIDCRTGAELAFGFYRLTLGQDTDGTLLVEVQNSAGGAEHADPIDQKKAFALTRVMPSKRLIGWVLAALILGLFLAWPIGSHLTHAAARGGQVVGDRAWDPGALSLAHHQLTDNCEACHVKGFQAVSDTTCRSCHRDVHDHAPAARIAAASGPPGLGGALLQTVAHAFGKPGPGACVDCHVEHLGAGQMQPTRQQFCSDCHAVLRSRLPDTKIGNAGDFATLHPQFTATVVTNADTRAVTRVSLDAHPREDSGLTFSHAAHLDPTGGVARMAMTLGGQGYGKPLDCQNCHHASEDGVRFQTISMERDCEACHSLVYDRVGGTARHLKHGSLAQAIADLTAAGTPRVATSTRMRPGEFTANGLYHASFTPAGGGAAARLMARNGLCGECHTAEARGGRPAVKPVTLVSRYMQHGWFDHAAHSQEACADCHAAKRSQTSADVLLPSIRQCRNCHVGENGGGTLASLAGTGAKIPSGCSLCHSYHVAPGAPTGLRRAPGRNADDPDRSDEAGGPPRIIGTRAGDGTSPG